MQIKLMPVIHLHEKDYAFLCKLVEKLKNGDSLVYRPIRGIIGKSGVYRNNRDQTNKIYVPFRGYFINEEDQFTLECSKSSDGVVSYSFKKDTDGAESLLVDITVGNQQDEYAYIQQCVTIHYKRIVKDIVDLENVHRIMDAASIAIPFLREHDKTSNTVFYKNDHCVNLYPLINSMDELQMELALNGISAW